MPDPAHKQLREGFWRMLLRIHYGIPGLKGSGFVSADGKQFTGGLAGMNTAWTLKASGMTMPPYEAIPTAGFYSFGQFWVQMLKLAGLDYKRMEDIVAALEKEFGIIPEEELEKGTEPVPTPQARLFPPLLGAAAARGGGMAPGVQFEVPVHGARFKIVYTTHFVDRFLHDEEERVAVSKLLPRSVVDGEIVRALPAVFEVLELDPEAEIIIVSREYGLSMKAFAIPIPGGWQLNMATMIVAAPLRRTSPREFVVSLNPDVPVRFAEGIPEDLQFAVLADAGSSLLGLEEGESRPVSGELSEAIVARTPDGFEVLEARWVGREAVLVEA